MSDRPIPSPSVIADSSTTAPTGPRLSGVVADFAGTDSQASRPVILIADDDPAFGWSSPGRSPAPGSFPLIASSAEEALRIVGERSVSLLLLDVATSGMSGYEAVEALRRDVATARIPVVLVTGWDDHESVVRGLDAGADDFLVKPVKPAELVARVRAHLRSQAAWVREVQDELHSRARVIDSLGGLSLSPDPVDAAMAVVGGLGLHAGSEIAVMFLVEGGRLEPLATFSGEGGTRPGGVELADSVSRHLLTRARFGPWADLPRIQVAARSPQRSALPASCSPPARPSTLATRSWACW